MVIPWRVVESTVTYADRWLRVRSDRCVMGADEVIAPYHVLEYADWLNAVALTPEGEVVMIHQYRHGVGSVVLELPAGAIEATDPDQIAAARRELMEETGFAAPEWTVLGRAYANAANQNNMSWSCLGIGATLVGPPARELGEDIEVECRDLAGLLRDVHAGRVVIPAMHLATLHFAVHHVLASDHRDLANIRERLVADLLAR